jgi:hypothetical protein
MLCIRTKNGLGCIFWWCIRHRIWPPCFLFVMKKNCPRETFRGSALKEKKSQQFCVISTPAPVASSAWLIWMLNDKILYFLKLKLLNFIFQFECEKMAARQRSKNLYFLLSLVTSHRISWVPQIADGVGRTLRPASVGERADCVRRGFCVKTKKIVVCRVVHSMQKKFTVQPHH